MNPNPATPNPEQLDALQRWAKQYGRTWKEALRDAWFHAGYRDFDGPSAPLQQLRNSFGPSWLTSYKLPTTHATPKRTSQFEDDIDALVTAYREDGRTYMLAKFRDLCESRKLAYWVAAALIDAVWQALCPGNDKASRLARVKLIKGN